eukprot:TRINITY_DN3221_c0_g1_i1.p1 TRINITY_DN3221_c0_g1~~TRINITY_DN3221_c0_g1_i1.p1  ORF type:complete len:585 (-),score=132.01 TRINITY_DN3221_c0_g1_i1:117-1871(-)
MAAPPTPKVPFSPTPGLQLDKIMSGLGSLTAEQLALFEEADFYSWNSQLALAEAKIEKLASTHVLFSLLYAKVAVVKAMISEYEPECEVAFQRLENTQKLATQWTDTASGESWFGFSKKQTESSQQFTKLTSLMCKVALGECAFYDSILKFRLQRYVSGVVNFRRSWKFYEECLGILPLFEKELEINYEEIVKREFVDRVIEGVPASDHKSKRIDVSKYTTLQRLIHHLASVVYLGAGIFHYIIDLVPKHFKWIVEGVFSLKADRELAVRELKQSFYCQGINSPMSAMILVSILVFWEEKREESHKMFDDLLIQFPEGNMFLYLGGYLMRSAGQLEKSLNYFEIVQKRAEVKQLALYATAEVGYNHFLTFNWELAIPQLETFIAESQVKGYRCYILLILGLCYEMINNRSAATDKWKAIAPICRKGFSLDEFSKRRANLMIARGGLSEFEKEFRKGIAQFETDRFEASRDTVEKAEGLIKNDDNRIAYCFLRGASYVKLKNYEIGKQMFNEGIALEKKVSKEESWLIPFIYCSLGEIYIEEQQYSEAVKTLKKAQSYTKYDFENWLQARVKRSLERIAKINPAS